MTGSAHENAIDVIRHNRVDHIGDLVLTLCPQITFEFGIFVEMILDRTLRAARDKNQISDARLDGLLDGILNDRFVNNREKLFRHGLGGRKKTGAKSSNGKDGFCYRVHHVSLFNHGCSKHPSTPPARSIPDALFVRTDQITRETVCFSGRLKGLRLTEFTTLNARRLNKKKKLTL